MKTTTEALLSGLVLDELERKRQGLDYQIDKENGVYRIQIAGQVVPDGKEERKYPSLGKALAGGFLLLFRLDQKLGGNRER